jgi:hypothetical protein
MIWAMALSGLQYGLHRKNPDHPVLKRYRLGLLNVLLWGGVAMLAIEHVARGEVVAWPPFLTAMQSPAGIPAMLQEMAVVGGLMTAAIFVAWAGFVAVLNSNLNKSEVRTVQ